MAAKKPAKTEKAAPVTGAQEEKLKALEHALADLDKQFGKGAVMKLGEHAEQNVQVIPTGCLTLDEALGVGGIPRGRIVEIFGPESSGKTTVALHIVAQAQKMGGIAAFVDAEHALDPVYAKNLGVNIDDLYVSQPDTGEQALEIVCWCAAARWTLLSSTLSPPSSRRRKSTAKWVILSSVCKRV